jgi:Holliday junction resolvasome RuvABC DNA-binding subunit
MQFSNVFFVADPMQISTYRSTIVAIFVSLALAGCDRNQSQPPQQSTINQTPSAHSQTKALRAASAVGYDGKQLQKQVDRVLEQKQKRDGDLEKALDDTGPQ